MLIKTVGEFRQAVRIGRQWHFGYDPYYITSDGGCLCQKCAESERRNIVDSIATPYNDGWKVVAMDSTANTDSEVLCEHCNDVLQLDWTERN